MYARLLIITTTISLLSIIYGTFLQKPQIPKSETMATSRVINKVFLALEQGEGAGARIRRSMPSTHLPNLSPFLLLDHFSSSSPAGFPDHPHRGQGQPPLFPTELIDRNNVETITYILSGSFSHEDFAGNRGTILSGGLQFMTAGRGIMHSEIPRPNPDGSPNIGLQLWVDLPSHLKMCEPRYRDLQAPEIPVVEMDGGKVKVNVISGVSGGVESVKELAYTPVWYLDVEIKPGGKITQEIPKGWNAFAYMLSGAAVFGGQDTKRVETNHCVVFERGG
jgi:quercetin 2,3-dioxygenase